MARPFRITGHRGAMGYMPENTLASYRQAVQDGVDEIELDLRLSKDGHIVLLHDSTVDRTTDGHGAVEDLTLAELQSLDAGAGERIPTFDEALAAIDITILAEIKADAVVEPLRRLLAARPELRHRIQPMCFRARNLEPLVRSFDDVRCALLADEGSEDLLDRAVGLGVAWVGVGWPGSSPELIRAAHERGLEYCLWPAPTRVEVERARDWGADGVTTDYPADVIEAPV
ncbi:glycerophosphodiester phosphodiesterase [Rugosimonospora africana]|uniref:Glycerophosphoryl diester phosphodiesterase n=1 Tax=Rugosimonospora africana TaxID=556532 RepID=A0A8J3QZE3_9ACTN|nr:glycerophosphodiester phosphodiesterase family protein [Rugosimonospora africana]GIH19396.1 glycerophosphoryl diester phosphodiesterase [Rugosimonospora africana]